MLLPSTIKITYYSWKQRQANSNSTFLFSFNAKRKEVEWNWIGPEQQTNSLLLHWFHSTPWNQLKKRSLSLWSSKPAKQANQLSSSLSFFDWKEERVMGACFVVAAGPPSLKIKDFFIPKKSKIFKLRPPHPAVKPINSINWIMAGGPSSSTNTFNPFFPLGRKEWNWIVCCCWSGPFNLALQLLNKSISRCSIALLFNN